jgi:DNA-binding GntR family transcriptional regulator
VSRSSVREALRHPRGRGLVERRGNRGLFVASITPDEARQIYEVRAAIEPEMARLFAARATGGRPRGAVRHAHGAGNARAARASSPTMCARSTRSSTR